MKFRRGVKSAANGEVGGIESGVVAEFSGRRRRLSRNQWTLVLVTLLVVLLAVLIGTLANSSVFSISNVRIIIRGDLITDSEVLSFTDAIKGTNYFNVDVERVAKNFESDPNVGVATVTKTFPNTVTITLESARPDYVVLTNFSTLTRVALNERGQPLSGVTIPSFAPIICSSRVQVFADIPGDFTCSQSTKVADVQIELNRINTLLSNWPLVANKILSVYVFNGYGVGIQDSVGDLIYFADANSGINSLKALSRIVASSQLPRPFLIDLSNLKSPFFLPVPAIKG